MNKAKSAIVIFVTVISILLASDYSHGAPNLDPPFISSVTPIQPLLKQRIIIRGRGFGNSMPKVYSLGDSVDTIDEGPGPSLAIHDHGSAAHSWAAGRMCGGNVDAIGLKIESWSDSEIVLSGFGSALGGRWLMDVGDPIEIIVYGPNNSGMATFKTAVVPQPQAPPPPKAPQPQAPAPQAPAPQAPPHRDLGWLYIMLFIIAIAFVFLLRGARKYKWLVAVIALIVVLNALKHIGYYNFVIEVLAWLFGAAILLPSVWAVIIFVNKSRGHYRDGLIACVTSYRRRQAQRYLWDGDILCKLLVLGSYKEAIKMYDQAIKLDPDLVLAYERRELAHSKIGNMENAIEDSRIAAQLSGKTLEDWLISHSDYLLPEENVDFVSANPTLWRRYTRTETHGRADAMGGGGRFVSTNHIERSDMDWLVLTNQRLLITKNRTIVYEFDLSWERIQKWITAEQQVRIKEWDNILQTWRIKGFLGIIKGDFISDDLYKRTPPFDRNAMNERASIFAPFLPITGVTTKRHLWERWTGIRLTYMPLVFGTPTFVTSLQGFLWSRKTGIVGEIQLWDETHTQDMLEKLRPRVEKVANVLNTRSNWRGA